MIRIPLSALLGMVLVGCCLSPACRCPEIDIPCEWHAPMSEGIETSSMNNFVWWEELDDPQLTVLLEQAYLYNPDMRLAASRLQKRSRGRCLCIQEESFCDTWNNVSAEVAKNYIILRGLQHRLLIIQRSIDFQQESIKLIVDLVDRGVVNEFDFRELEGELNAFAAEKPLIELEMNKTINHLSILLGYSPGELSCELLVGGRLPQLPCCKPIGSPCELIGRRSDIKLARQGLAAGTDQARVEYQKTVLTALEEVENGIASYHFELERHLYLNEVYHSHQQAMELMQDLSRRGLKNETDLLAKKVVLFNAESALLQSQVDLLLHYVSLYKALGNACCGCSCE